MKIHSFNRVFYKNTLFYFSAVGQCLKLLFFSPNPSKSVHKIRLQLLKIYRHKNRFIFCKRTTYYYNYYSYCDMHSYSLYEVYVICFCSLMNSWTVRIAFLQRHSLLLKYLRAQKRCEKIFGRRLFFNSKLTVFLILFFVYNKRMITFLCKRWAVLIKECVCTK